jgi:hypothetical protein
MAWMNQERKAALAAGLKIVLPKGWTYSLFGKWDKPFRCSTAPMMGCDKCHAETIDVRRRENGQQAVRPLRRSAFRRNRRHQSTVR